MGISNLIALSSDDGVSGRPSRRWPPGHALPRIKSASVDDIRRRFSIPDSVQIHSHSGLFDPVGDDEVVASLYQLECGLSMPIDRETCETLSGWGIALPQVHPSIFLAISRLFTIARVYCRHFLPYDIQQLIIPRVYGGTDGGTKRFHCIWRLGKDLDGCPKSYKNWESPCFRFRNWRKAHQLDLPRQLANAVVAPPKDVNLIPYAAGSHERIERLFNLHRDLFDVSFPDSIVYWVHKRDKDHGRISAPISASPIAQASFPLNSVSYPQAHINSKKRHSSHSSSSGFLRIRRKRHCSTRSKDISATPPNGSKKFRRLRLAHKDRRTNPYASIPCPNTAETSDAVSGKVWTSVRRSHRLHNKDYTFREFSSCTSNDISNLGLSGNRESSSSIPNMKVSGAENESFEDISSNGPPSPFLEPNTAQVGISHAAFVGDNYRGGKGDPTPPGCTGVTQAKRKMVIESTAPSVLLSNHLPLPEHGLPGSGSTIPCTEVDHAGICRRLSVPDLDTGNDPCLPAFQSLTFPNDESQYNQLLRTVSDNYSQFVNSIARLRNECIQRSSACNACISKLLEISKLQSATAKMSVVIKDATKELDLTKKLLDSARLELHEERETSGRALLAQTLELSGVKQELADSISREAHLQASLDKIKGILHVTLGGHEPPPGM